MKALLLALSLVFTASAHASSGCVCTCVVKESEGTFTTLTGKGEDRESAGESLKKKLGKRKCELSPDCKGKACKADE